MSKVKKISAILKRAMTERHTGWSRKDWNSRSKTHWRSSAVEDAGQSSHDKWKSSKIQGKWKEVSREMDVLDSSLKEKKHIWNKSCKESAKRETELFKMTEICANDEKQEDNERNIIKKTPEQLREKRTGRRLYRDINGYMCSWDQEVGRPHDIMDKVWQMMQSNDTMTMNLDKDFEELTEKTQQTGVEWIDKNKQVLDGKKRFSLGEMMMQGDSVLLSTYVTHWQYRNILNDIDNLAGSVRGEVRAHV